MAKGCWQLAEAGKRQEKTLGQSLQKKRGPAETLNLDLWLPELGEDRLALYLKLPILW